jgi:hypothetical protein
LGGGLEESTRETRSNTDLHRKGNESFSHNLAIFRFFLFTCQINRYFLNLNLKKMTCEQKLCEKKSFLLKRCRGKSTIYNINININ